MKKRFVVLLLVLCCMASPAFSDGNGGRHKIGGYVGWPVGMSYSYEFSRLFEIDLLVAWNGYSPALGGLNIHIGGLFTVWDPVVEAFGNQRCPLTIGPVVGTTLGVLGGWSGGSLDIMAALRWELNFSGAPGFNLFFDWAPVGMSVNFSTNAYSGIAYTSRGGVGLRYRIPR
ncbi:MAG: hypothetical protein JXR63_03440 [Spirochaetales bacterium]|nr:hypothetical protein [Spirochaetales bacterium]